MDRIHTTLSPKSGLRVRQCTAKHDHSVINTAWVPMQNFLGDERPFVHFIRDPWGKRTTTLVRKVDVTWVTCSTGCAATFGVWRESYTFVHEEHSGGNTRGESSG